MSAALFFRNFLLLPQEMKKNICCSTRDKRHVDDDTKNQPKIQKTPDFHLATHIKTEEQEYLDVPLIFVFFPESKNKQHNQPPDSILVSDETLKLLLEVHRREQSTTNKPVQLTTKQNIKELNQANRKTEECTALQIVSSSNHSTALREQLPKNARRVKSNIPSIQLKYSQIWTKPSRSTTPAGLVTSDPNYELSRMNGGLLSALLSSSEDLYNIVVSQSKAAIVGEPRTSATTKTTPNKCYSANALKRKRISLASCIVYEDEVSHPEESQCPAKAQRLVSLNNSEADEEVSAPSSSETDDSRGNSFSRFRYVQPMVYSNLPSGSTLVSKRGVYRTIDKDKPFACAHCGKTYMRKRSVFSHIQYQHDEKCYCCEFCDKRFAQQSLLSSHMRIHTKEKPFTCGQCGRSFRFRTALCKHKHTHSEERPFPCNECNKSFKTREDLSRHSKTHLKDEERPGVICNICKKKLSTSYNLKLHMTTHTGEKPFKCTLCDKQFGRSSQLQYHMNTHNGTKRFPDKSCTVCGKTISGNHMRDHMRVHSGEKPFECSICLKRFPKKQNLEGHMRSHTGEKPFACSGCDKRFALYSNMVTHKVKCMM